MGRTAVLPGTLESLPMMLKNACRVLIALVCLSLATAAAAQTQAPAKPFEPTVGQAGKDVVWVPTPQALVDKMLDMAQVTPKGSASCCAVSSALMGAHHSTACGAGAARRVRSRSCPARAEADRGSLGPTGRTSARATPDRGR